MSVSSLLDEATMEEAWSNVYAYSFNGKRMMAAGVDLCAAGAPGESGQILATDGDGKTEWIPPPRPGYIFGFTVAASPSYAVANGFTTSAPQAVSSQITSLTMGGDGTVKVVGFDTASGNATSQFEVLRNGVSMGVFNLTGPLRGSLDYSFEFARNDYLEVRWTGVGTIAGGTRITLFL